MKQQIKSYGCLCLSEFQLGTFPPQATPGDSLKKIAWDLTFESCSGAGNSTRAGILCLEVRISLISVLSTGQGGASHPPPPPKKGSFFCEKLKAISNTDHI